MYLAPICIFLVPAFCGLVLSALIALICRRKFKKVKFSITFAVVNVVAFIYSTVEFVLGVVQLTNYESYQFFPQMMEYTDLRLWIIGYIVFVLIALSAEFIAIVEYRQLKDI